MRAIREVAEDVSPEAAADRVDDVVLTADHFDRAREALPDAGAD